MRVKAFVGLCIGFLVTVGFAIPGLAQTSSEVPFVGGDLAGVARATMMGGSLSLIDVPIYEGMPGSTIELKRVGVFTPDAKIIVHHADGIEVRPAPNNVYLRGKVITKGADDGDIRANLTVRASGEVRGILAGRGEYWMIGSDAGKTTGLMIRNVQADSVIASGAANYSFNCGTDALVTPKDLLLEQTKRSGITRRKASYTARIAVDTDYEFYQLFGNTSDAEDYVADLVSYSSGTYDSEVDTSLYLSSVTIRATSSDPWTESTSICLLYQFGRYWNNNYSGITRTTAFYLSGKSTGGGVAWVGVLCRGAFSLDIGLSGCGLSPNYDNYGGAYGFVGSLSGAFDINNPQVIWDIVAFSHELGHNFDSDHTHCYGGIGGNANPVDECYAGECGQTGCFCGSPSLPCTGMTGCGTIMSYCHLLSGGMSNISFTFGEGHPYGVEPGRVPDVMNAHVVYSDSTYSGCLDYIAASEIFSDDFESGNTNSWSYTSP
jgi:hypothetical protein